MMTSPITRITIAVFLLTLASCKLEPCKDYRCINGMALEDGKNCICLCNYGWDGSDCTVEDKCVTNNVICYNGGYCNNSGVCVCVSGYEGDSCELLSRDRLLGATDTSFWNATDTCGSLIYQYVIEIQPGSDNRTVELYNIRDLGENQFITVTVSRLNCTQHTDVAIGSVEIRDLFGTVTSDSSTLRVNYKSDDGLTTNCSGTWMRQ